jgi:hypothetical protein
MQAVRGSAAVATRRCKVPDLLTSPHEVTGLDGRIHRLVRHSNLPHLRVIDHENENRLAGHGPS